MTLPDHSDGCSDVCYSVTTHQKRTLKIAIAGDISENRPAATNCEPLAPCKFCLHLAQTALNTIEAEGWTLSKAQR